jgi:hypothetical protein
MSVLSPKRIEEEVDYYLKSPQHNYSEKDIRRFLKDIDEDWGLGVNLMPNKLKKKKGGSVKTSKYAKGGGVRKSKYSL